MNINLLDNIKSFNNVISVRKLYSKSYVLFTIFFKIHQIHEVPIVIEIFGINKYVQYHYFLGITLVREIQTKYWKKMTGIFDV